MEFLNFSELVLKFGIDFFILIFRAKVSGLWNGRVHFWKKNRRVHFEMDASIFEMDASKKKWTRPFSKMDTSILFLDASIFQNGRVHFQMDASIFFGRVHFQNGRVHFLK